MDAALIAILLAFFSIMVCVLGLCLRERRRALQINDDLARAGRLQNDDQRIALMLFGGITSGAALALLTAYLMFFRAGI